MGYLFPYLIFCWQGLIIEDTFVTFPIALLQFFSLSRAVVQNLTSAPKNLNSLKIKCLENTTDNLIIILFSPEVLIESSH